MAGPGVQRSHTLPDRIARGGGGASGGDLRGRTHREPAAGHRFAVEGRDGRLQRDESGELTEADLALAGAISSKASELGATVDFTGLQSYQVAIDALVIPDVLPFWETVLGYERFGDALIDPHSEGPTFWFQQMDAPRPQRNRIHIDVWVPHDQAEERVAAAIAR